MKLKGNRGSFRGDLVSKSARIELLLRRISLLQDRILVTEDPYLRDNLYQDLKNCRKHLEEAIKSSPALDLSQPSEEG